MDELQEARKQIDEIDEEMAKLFVRRMRAAQIIGDYKRRRGLPILDATRERALTERAATRVQDCALRELYVQFLKETMSLSREYQRLLNEGMKIAYCGTTGAFAYEAAGKLFPGATRVSYPDFAGAYHATEAGECNLCVLPLENSYNGEVGQVTDLLFSGSLYIGDVAEFPIHHHLCVIPGTKLADIRMALSHPQALGQCAAFLHEHGLLAREYENTATAAQYVAQCADPAMAAIAGEEAARCAGLEILCADIQTSAQNTTRFAVLSTAPHFPAAGIHGVHSVLLFTVRNEAGSLAQALSVIGKHGFNLRTLRSRPMKELLWNYYFYVEAEGNVYSRAGEEMLAELSVFCDKLRVAGTYKKD